MFEQSNSYFVLPLVTRLAAALEKGGFEHYFVCHDGADARLCAQALEETLFIDNPLPGLMLEAIAIVGNTTLWDDAMARKRAVDALSADDRQKLRMLSDILLDELYEADIVLDR